MTAHITYFSSKWRPLHSRVCRAIRYATAKKLITFYMDNQTAIYTLSSTIYPQIQNSYKLSYIMHFTTSTLLITNDVSRVDSSGKLGGRWPVLRKLPPKLKRPLKTKSTQTNWLTEEKRPNPAKLMIRHTSKLYKL